MKKQKTVKHQQQWWSPNNNNNNDSQISVWGFNTRHREKRQQGRGKARKGQARKRWSDLIASGRGRPPGIFSKAGSGTERGTGCQARLGWGLPPQSRDPTPWSDGLIYPARLFSGSISCRIVSFPPPFWFSLQWFSSGLFLCPCIFFLLKPGLFFFFFFSLLKLLFLINPRLFSLSCSVILSFLFHDPLFAFLLSIWATWSSPFLEQRQRKVLDRNLQTPACSWEQKGMVKEWITSVYLSRVLLYLKLTSDRARDFLTGH